MSSNNMIISGSKILNRSFLRLYIAELQKIRLTHSPPGSGAGKGGGHGGAVREAGGALGRYGAANEEGYFYNKSKEDIEKMKKKLKEQGDKQNLKSKGEEGED